MAILELARVSIRAKTRVEHSDTLWLASFVHLAAIQRAVWHPQFDASRGSRHLIRKLMIFSTRLPTVTSVSALHLVLARHLLRHRVMRRLHDARWLPHSFCWFNDTGGINHALQLGKGSTSDRPSLSATTAIMRMTSMRAATASPTALWTHAETQRGLQMDRAHVNVSVDALAATTPRHEASETRTFGWELHYDAGHDVEYFVHSYTGEVRWPEPRRPEGGMLRAHGADETSHEWSPSRHQAVWLPSGPTTCSSAARFPVFAAMRSGVHPVQLNFAGWNILQESAVAPDTRLEMMTQGHRILPPTWETMHSGSPFLSRYPVFVSNAAHDGAQYEDKENEDGTVQSSRRPPMTDNSAHQPLTAPASLWRSLFPADVPGENQQSPPRPRPAVGPAPAYTASAPTYAKKKEHNRRGYSLRLQRKQLKMEVAHACGSSRTGNTIESERVDHATRVSVASKAS